MQYHKSPCLKYFAFYLIVLLLLDGNWGAWSSLSTCTVTCGGGTQSHTRLCNNPPPSNGGAACPGSSSENAPCNLQLCPIGKKI